MRSAQAYAFVSAALTLVACSAAPAQDQSQTIALAVCDQKEACGQNVDVLTCVGELRSQIVAVCSDDEARTCSSALSSSCSASFASSGECAPCR